MWHIREKPPFGGHASIEYQFHHVPSSTPSPLRGPLLHGKASHVVFRSLTLPYKPRSLATLKGARTLRSFLLASLVIPVGGKEYLAGRKAGS